jgi:hypothetical protein
VAIAQPLVTTFLMIVKKILTNGILQPVLAEEDHPRETLFPVTPHETFDVRREIG